MPQPDIDFSFGATGVGAFQNTLNSTLRKIGSFGKAAAVSLGLLTAGFGLATAAASKFEKTFLQLRNLNTDKSQAEIRALRSEILALSLETGLGANALSRAYFDVQSANVATRDGIKKIVKDVGLFARATGADLNKSIESTVKTMRAFNLEASDTERIFAANFATIQGGIVTYDELAQRQVVFAGAAGAANQTIESANALFAALSVTGASVRVSASKAASAFEGLADPAIAKGLENIGVEVFDANRQLNQMDIFIPSLVKELGKLTPDAFRDLSKELGGPDGFSSLLQQARVNGDKLNETIKNFGETTKQLDISKIIKDANGDVSILTGIVKNQLNTLFIKLGEVILPTVAGALNDLSISIRRVFGDEKQLEGGSLALDGVLKGIVQTLQTLGSIAKTTFNAVKGFVSGLVSPLTKLDEVFGSLADNFAPGQALQSTQSLNAYWEEFGKRVGFGKKTIDEFRKTLGDYNITGKRTDVIQREVNQRFKEFVKESLLAKLAALNAKKVIDDVVGGDGNDSGGDGNDKGAIPIPVAPKFTFQDFSTLDQQTDDYLATLPPDERPSVDVSVVAPTNAFEDFAQSVLNQSQAVKDAIQRNMQEPFNQLKADIKDIGKSALVDLAGGLGRAFGDAITGAKSLGDSLKDLALDIAQAATQAAGLALIQMSPTLPPPANLAALSAGLLLVGVSGLLGGIAASRGGQGQGESQSFSEPGPSTAGPNTSGLSNFTGTNQEFQPVIYNNFKIELDGEPIAANVIDRQQQINNRQGN